MAEFSGHLSLRAAAQAGGSTGLAAQSFRAPFHLSKSYWDAAAGVLIVQVVNPTAGILAGDRLDSAIAVEAGAALLVTTPSASRIFKMEAGGSAESRQHFSVAAGGWLEVAPEPLVPHRGSRFRQVTTVDVKPGGALFFVDQLQPGRVAHNEEAWQWDRLCLELTVRLGGELILRERLDQTGDELRALAKLAGSGPAACFANAVLIADEAGGNWREELSRLHRDGLWVGVSALRRGGWSLRLVASDSVKLRQGLRDMRRILAAGHPRLAADLRKL
ncbi:MAG TPA: urease accessory protein UreD [Lacunisphaera sp.]|nr:urease accessory protein UreD [Lacunisphaera sp.]